MSPGKSETNNNKFIDLLRENLPEEITVKNFDFMIALFSKYQILHVHWPDRLYRAESGSKTLAKRLLLILLILRIFFLKTKVIWTVHDKLPHETMSFLEVLLNSAFTKIVNSKIYLQKDSDFNEELDFLIKHGSYKNENSQFKSLSNTYTKSVICVGFLRPSKNVESLIEKFPKQTLYQLIIMGQPISMEYNESLVSSRRRALT